MIMTVREARVQKERWGALRAAWEDQTRRMRPPQLIESFLVQDANDGDRWRIVSLWPDRTALEEMRKAEPTPGGVVIFRAAGAEPELSLFDVSAVLPRA